MAKLVAAQWGRLKSSSALSEALESLSSRYVEEFDELAVDDMSFAAAAAEIKGARMALRDVIGFIGARVDLLEAEEAEASARDREESQDTE